MTLLLLFLAFTLAGGAGQFVETRLESPGKLAGFECADVNHDGRPDLVVALREDAGRSLRLHLQAEGGGFSSAPNWRISLPNDVVSYALFDVREEQGDELLLFTAGGVFSVSPARAGLRDNLRRELTAPLFPDLADPRSVPRWDGTEDIDGDGRPELLVPSAEALVCYGVAAGANDAPLLLERAQIPVRVTRDSILMHRRAFGGSMEVRATYMLAALFPGAATSVPRVWPERLFGRSEEWSLPTFTDWNGDGRVDAVATTTTGFDVLLQDEEGRFDAGEPHPVGLGRELDRNDDTLLLVDLDRDGWAEVVLQETEGKGLTREYSLTVFRRAADGSLAADPSARIKLEATRVDFDLVDIDGDGRSDVVARVIDLPRSVENIVSVRLEMSLLVFLGQEGAGLSRHPDLRRERSLRPEQLERIRESLLVDLTGDYDGDGLRDLLTTQPNGVLQIVPVCRHGAALEFADEPLVTFLPVRPVLAARPVDLSPDGVSDLVLRHEDALTVLVSRPGGGR